MKINVEHLKKDYDGKSVLNIESLEIPCGKITAIIGPNGAGKSTLLNLIAGIDQATSGRITYEGEAEIPRNQITMGFQKPYLFNTTVDKNIGYPLKIRGWDRVKIEERTRMLAVELNLSDHRKKKSWKLSGGEIQKVALARSLSFSPKLLLLDEPTANIDPSTVSDIEKILKRFNQEEDTTIVIISHNLAQARRISDYVVLLNHGKVVEANDCATFFHAPSKEETQRFIAQEIIT
jgi:tungstate transport system ATP-binding protein